MQALSSFHSAFAAMRVSTEHHHARSTESAAPVHARPIESRPRETTDPETSGSVSSLSYRRSEKTTLYIRTQEGDVVRLTFKTRESASLQVAQAQDADGETTEIALNTRSSSKLSIKIHGDLNEEEVAAIQDAIDQAIDLADDFFGGDLQAAFESAAAFDIDGEQLASVKLRMSTRERLTYSVRGFVSTPMTRPEISPETATTPAPPSDPTPAIAPALIPATSEPPAAAVEDAPESTAPTEEPASSPEAEAEPLERLFALRTIGEFIDRLLDSLGGNEDAPQQDSLQLSLKIRIVQSTLLAISLTRPAEEAPLPELLPELLDALAEQEQAPLDEVV